MININTLRDQTEQVKLALGKRGYKLNAEKFEKLEQQRKSMQVKAQELQEQRNQVSKKIGLEKSKGNKVDELMKQVNSTAEALKSYEEQLEKIQSDLQVLLLVFYQFSFF